MIRYLPFLLLTCCHSPSIHAGWAPLLPEPSEETLKAQADERRFLNYGVPMP